MPLPGEPPVEHLIQIKNDLRTIAVDTGAFESRCILTYEITFDENSPTPEEGEIKIVQSRGVWRNKPDDSIVFIPTKKNTFIFALEAKLTHPETGEETVKKVKGITLIASACRVNYIEPPASLNFNLRRGQKRVRIPEFVSIVPDCPVVAYSLQSYLEPFQLTNRDTGVIVELVEDLAPKNQFLRIVDGNTLEITDIAPAGTYEFHILAKAETNVTVLKEG